MVKNVNRTFRINWFSFVFAFPPTRNIIKYPTPYNANKIVYKNLDDQCYKYNAEEVKCSDSSLTQPII